MDVSYLELGNEIDYNKIYENSAGLQNTRYELTG